MFASWTPEQPEITDLIVQHDPYTLARLPVRKRDVLEVFMKFGNRKAMRVVEALPERDGVLDEKEIDRLLVRTHWEMQRLGEEFYHGPRVYELLRGVIDAIRRSGFKDELKVVDVGCGIGYDIRWLAARTELTKQGVELTGFDLNSALIHEANRLSAAERLPCQFLHGDAYSLDHAGHIFVSTGVIHHFRGAGLREFLQRHERPETQAFLHFDFQPWFLAPYGSWFFHFLRMRTQVARHDGVLSAARAHSAGTLTEAARNAAPGFASGIYGAKIWNTPAPRVFHTLIGIRRPLIDGLGKALGRQAPRLGELR